MGKDVSFFKAALENEERLALDAKNELTRVTHEKEAKEQELMLLQAASGVTTHGLEWQYNHENTWCAFAVDANIQTQKAYMRYLDGGPHELTLTIGGVIRMLDFKAMHQTNAATRVKRSIKLKLDVPSSWSTPAHALLQQTSKTHEMYVSEDDNNVWVAMRKLLSTSQCTGPGCSLMAKVTVKSIHRIENYALYQKYNVQLKQMQEDLHRSGVMPVGDINPKIGVNTAGLEASVNDLSNSFQLNHQVNEKLLLHGTSYQDADHIVKSGFDPRVCHRGMYGTGTYFASEACKSHQYTCKQHAKACNCTAERTVILARVALGDPFYTKSVFWEKRRPPLRSNGQGLHQSIVANPGWIKGHTSNPQCHQEFVIFDVAQAYPTYIVQYVVS